MTQPPQAKQRPRGPCRQGTSSVQVHWRSNITAVESACELLVFSVMTGLILIASVSTSIRWTRIRMISSRGAGQHFSTPPRSRRRVRPDDSLQARDCHAHEYFYSP